MKTVAVIGAGQMGAGIAQVVAQAGITVLLADIDLASAERGKAAVGKALERLVARGRMEPGEVDDVLAKVRPVADYVPMVEADLIIEAATEKEEIKRKIFAGVAPYLAQGAIMASNTSSIPITRMAASMPDP